MSLKDRTNEELLNAIRDTMEQQGSAIELSNGPKIKKFSSLKLDIWYEMVGRGDDVALLVKDLIQDKNDWVALYATEIVSNRISREDVDASFNRILALDSPEVRCEARLIKSSIKNVTKSNTLYRHLK